MMTRKDFEQFARWLRKARPAEIKCPPNTAEAAAQYEAALRQWRKDCEHIAAVLMMSNQRFDQARFIAACEEV